MNRRTSVALLSAILLLVISAVFSMTVGAAGLSFDELWAGITHASGSEAASAIVYEIRLPRLLAAILVGASLAVAGAVLQSAFANPVVDPSLVGVSGAAGIGAMFGGLTVFGATGSTLFALLGAIVTMWWLQRSGGQALQLLLAGFAVGAFTQGLLATLSNFGAVAQGRSLTSWLFGTLAVATMDSVPWLLLGVGLGAGLLWKQSQAMDILSGGIESAFALGVDTSRLRRRLLIAAAILVAPSVVWFGVVGFVGLLVPHSLRALGFNTHRSLLPLSLVVGATIVLLADTAARTLVPMTEIPLSILLSLVGAPVLLVLVKRMR